MGETKNSWKRATFILLIFLCIGVCYILYEVKKEMPGSDIFKAKMCIKIQGTPSWASSDGEIIAAGYTNFGEVSYNVVEEVLIPNKIYFIYNPDCGWCKKQIEYFGSTWDKYKESGFTVDCSN